MTDKLLTEKEASKMLSLSPTTLRQWRHSGNMELRWVKIGGAVRYKESEIQIFINNSSCESPTKPLIVNIPDAFCDLPDRTAISRKELADIIGRGTRALSGLMARGTLPQPINKKTAIATNRLVWSLGDIRKLKINMDSK
jgi:predicted DNA-binding transcriptional regulator AlpA